MAWFKWQSAKLSQYLRNFYRCFPLTPSFDWYRVASSFGRTSRLPRAQWSQYLSTKGKVMRVKVCSCLVLFAFAAFAQSDRGTITGTVLDPAGAVVANAPIEARNTATGALYPAASSGTGN